MEEKFFQYNSHEVFYGQTGAGPAVMLVHGFGEDGIVWKNQVDFLKSNYRLIIPDHAGSGRSRMGNPIRTMDDMAEILKAIADRESIGQFTLIGHSMGGYIALAFAEKYGERLNGFGLFQSTSFPDSEEKKATRRKGIEFMEKHGGFEFLKTSTPNLFSQITKDEMPSLVDEFIDSLHNFQAAPLVSYYEAMMARPDRTAVLKNINVAVLLIAGEFDVAVPLKDVLALAHLPGKLYFHVLKKSGHMGMLEEAERSNRLLQEYLTDLNPNRT